MADRPKRKISSHPLNISDSAVPKKFPGDPLKPASDADKANWNGFCEIESEPAFFNVMLRDFGVQGIKVQEVFSLDDDMLACLPRPIYGLVFLFRWIEEDPEKQEQSCPEGVWFANQTVENACASVALLNIVNNVPNIELGENLQQFKDFTAGLTPALRGDAISNFSFVKQIHNSFARKLDMLNADLHMKNVGKSRKKAKGNKTNKSKKVTDDTSEAGFHFIAYVPVNGDLWKFDGLERQPQKLAKLNGIDWIAEAKPDIETRMAVYEEGAGDFVLMSLVHDPLPDLTPALAENLEAIEAIAARMEQVTPQSKPSMSNGDRPTHPTTGSLLGPDPTYGPNQVTSDQASIPEVTTGMVNCDDLAKLTEHHSALTAAQVGIRSSIREELESRRSDQEKANGRRFDFGPLALKLAQILARSQEGLKKRKSNKRQRRAK